MNDMVAAFEIRAKADQAKAEMSQLRGELDKTGAAAEQASTKGKQLGPALVEPLRNLSPALDPIPPKIRKIGEELDPLPPKLHNLQNEFENVGKGAATGGSYMARNLAFQFNQMMQMGAVTGNYMQAIAIQIPDIASSFGFLGTIIGGIAGVSLPLLVNMFTGASNSGKELDNTLSEINTAFDAYAKYAEIAAMETLELKEKFHGFASEVQGFSAYMKGLETVKVLDGLRESVNPMKGALADLQETYTYLTTQQKNLAIASGNGPFADPGMVSIYRQAIADAGTEIDDIAKRLDMTREEALSLASAMDDVGASTSFVDIAASAGAALAIIRQIYPDSQDIPKPLRAAVEALSEMQQRAAEASDSLTVAQTMGDALMTALDSAAGAASMLGASVPGSGWLDGAISGASRLASQLWDAAKARAAATATTDPTGLREMDDERGSQRPQVHSGTGYTRDRLRAEARRGAAGGGRGGGGGSIDRESFDALTKSAEEALAAMDAAIAAIHEKVALGLMSTAEGEEAISRAKDHAATAIADLIPKMQAANDVSGDQAAKAVEKWRLEVRGLADDYEDVNDKIAESSKNAARSSFADWLRGAKSGKDAIDDFGQHVLDTLARIASQRFADAIFNPFIDSLVGSIFGPTAVAANAKGVAKSAKSVAKADTVVTKPALFAFAKGAGGSDPDPDASPSHGRDAADKLGVRSSGSGGTQVTVNVHNNAPGAKATASARNDGGMQIIDVFIDQIWGAIAEDIATGRGQVPAVMAATYGLSRVGR